MHALHPTLGQLLQGIRRDIRLGQHLNRRQQNPRNIQRHIPLPHNHSLLPALQVRIKSAQMRQTIVPADEITCAIDTRERGLARNGETTIAACAVCEHEGVVAFTEGRNGSGTCAHTHVSNKGEARVLCDFIKLVLHGLM